jgi:hypothetical protein
MSVWSVGGLVTCDSYGRRFVDLEVIDGMFREFTRGSLVLRSSMAEAHDFLFIPVGLCIFVFLKEGLVKKIGF